MPPENIVIILIILFLLYLYYINKKENYSSINLPDILNKLPETKLKYFDKSYFLNDVKYINKNNYILQNKNIYNYDTKIIYDEKLKSNVIGVLSKVPSSAVYHFILFNDIDLNKGYIDKINEISNYLTNIMRQINANTAFLYLEFPYKTVNNEGVCGILLIYYSGRILYFSYPTYFYVNKLTNNNIYVSADGNSTFIDLIKNYPITSLDITSNRLDDKTKTPKDFILNNFKYTVNNVEKKSEINHIFKQYGI
jgi:hypothetical protein